MVEGARTNALCGTERRKENILCGYVTTDNGRDNFDWLAISGVSAGMVSGYYSEYIKLHGCPSGEISG